MINDITDRLFELKDEEYGRFHRSLVPEISPELIIGVRVPKIRTIAKELIKEENFSLFLETLPHKYYEENMLHALILSEFKDYEESVEYVDSFLPYIDNWAVCDSLSPKSFKKNKNLLMFKIREWISSEHVYTCRFGIEMLMKFFLDEDFSPEILELPAHVYSNEYYVKMMVSWFFATALAKQWDASVPYIENRLLEPWVHNKTIQKSVESFRVSDEHKAYLKMFKVK